MLDRTRSTMGKACLALDGCVDRVTGMLVGGEYDKNLASHLAWLTKQLAGVTDALRKLEAHDAKTVSQMSPEKRDELVMAYLAALTPERRAVVIAKLADMNRSGSVLS
jgi:hypothetical protein